MSKWMKTFCSFAALAAAIAAGGAAAADLPSTKAAPAPPLAPAFSWQGSYIGAYAGALLGEGTFTYFGDTPLRGSGFVGGGTLGYNWQWSPTIVLGLEADFGYRGAINAETVAWNTPSPTDTGVFGTFRGQLGYAFTPKWILYERRASPMGRISRRAASPRCCRRRSAGSRLARPCAPAGRRAPASNTLGPTRSP